MATPPSRFPDEVAHTTPRADGSPPISAYWDPRGVGAVGGDALAIPGGGGARDEYKGLRGFPDFRPPIEGHPKNAVAYTTLRLGDDLVVSVPGRDLPPRSDTATILRNATTDDLPAPGLGLLGGGRADDGGIAAFIGSSLRWIFGASPEPSASKATPGGGGARDEHTMMLRGFRDFRAPIVLGYPLDGQPSAPVRIEVRCPPTIDLRTTPVVMLADGEPVDDMYFPISDPSVAVAYTPHFSVFEFKVGSGELRLDVDRVKEDTSRKPGTLEHASHFFEDTPSERRVFSRGGFPYAIPVNMHRRAIPCDVDRWIKTNDTVVGYHGVADMNAAVAIIRDGFKLPSELGGPKDGHIPMSARVFGIENWAEAVFLSPSPKYCMAPHYGGAGTLREVEKFGICAVSGSVDKDGNYSFVLLQCRIRKAGLTANPKTRKPVFPDTSGLRFCDSRISGDAMEYRVPSPEDICVVGICVRSIPFSNANDIYEFVRDGSQL